MESTNCEICGGAQRRMLYRAQDLFYNSTSDVFTYVQCKTCGHVYLNPRPTGEETAAVYPADYGAHQAAVYPLHSPRRKVTWIGRVLTPSFGRWVRRGESLDADIERLARQNPGLTVLDIGSGTGTFMVTARAWGCRCVGLEPNAQAVAIARQAGLEVYQGTLTEAPLSPETFDLARMHHVFEHVHDPYEALVHTNKVLKPGALLAITVPCRTSVMRKVFGKYWFPLQPPFHLHVYSISDIKRLAARTGFVVEKVVFSWSASALAPSLLFAWHYGLLRQRIPVPAWRVERLLNNKVWLVAGLPICAVLAALGLSNTASVVLRKTATRSDMQRSARAQV